MSAHKSLKVCFITDNKPGHKNQLLGLEQALLAKIDLESCWSDVSDGGFSLLSMLRAPDSNLPFKPDVVIAAGRKTQWPLWCLKKKLRCYSVLLMRPSVLPKGCFDALIIPKHDNPPAHERIFESVGVLNKVRPSPLAKPSRNGLILIGGDSKHYQWDNQAVIEQVSTLIRQNTSIDRWCIGDSRRTPAEFRSLLKPLLSDSVSFMPVEDSSAEWLPKQMNSVDQIWVTPDSVSMVYEALSSGKITGVFDLLASSSGRIVKGINELVEAGDVMTLSKINRPLKTSVSFCEADRAVEWLLARLK